MADLIVRPSYQLDERDILTVDKLNLMATPVVELSIEAPVNDQNFFRNGNFYSSFWHTPAGIDCPIGVSTENAFFFLATPQGDTVNYAQDTVVPDLFSLWSVKLTGNPSTGAVEFGAQIVGDLAATLRRPCTFSSYLKNDTGLLLSPQLNFYTCNAFNNFDDFTLQLTIDLPSIQDGLWGYETGTTDLSTLANVANGLYITILLPAGSMNGTSKVVHFSRWKFQIGEIATEFADDSTLFDQTPTIGAANLQDGCIARPSLFLPQVVPAGAYISNSINEADINANAVDNRNLADQSVDTRVLADGAVTLPKLAAALLSYLLPSGSIWPFAGNTIPTDWLECIGTEVLIASYPNLFAAIGTIWGAGNGTTTFNLPDFRSLTLMGAGQGTKLPNLSNRLIGTFAGEELHHLLVTELPSHNHVLHDGQHNHVLNENAHSHGYSLATNNMDGANSQAGPNVRINWLPANTTSVKTGITINPSGANITIDPIGSDVRHNTMQPTAVVRWMIRT